MNGNRLLKTASHFYAMPRTAMLSLALFGLLTCPGPSDAESLTTESKTTVVRNGAGNYYEIISRVPKGTRLEVVSELGGWYKVRLPDGTIGFVSRISLIQRKKKQGGYQYDSADSGVGRVSAPVVIAATKGVTDLGPFARQYAQKRNIDTAVLEKLLRKPFTPAEYEEFKKRLSRRNKIRIDAFSAGRMENIDREIGAAIALRFCSGGVSTNEKLRKYVSLVGTAAVENTPFYDEDFVFVVLDSPQVKSFAAPGGYIFITSGAIAQMKSEAELAGVLSHEAVHVVRRHGIRELERQKTRIESQKAMGSLDEELKNLDMDKGDESVTSDMDELADRMFESLISGRKIEDEDEADRLGTLLLSNTGYSPDGLKNFLLALEKIDDEQKDGIYNHRQNKDRITSIDFVIRTNRLSGKDKVYLEDRFKKNMNY